MKTQSNTQVTAFLIQSASCLLLFGGTLMAFFGPHVLMKASRPPDAHLSLAQRVSYQRSIEEVYWRHRIWPKENLNPKPPLDSVMPQARLEQEVRDYLQNSQALEDKNHEPLTPDQLQAEMERMAAQSKQPEVLHELFQALGNDPHVVAECLARPVLAGRMLASLEGARTKAAPSQPEVKSKAVAITRYALPKVADGGDGCTDDTWTPTSITNAPSARYTKAVWTGSEMIVWGGQDSSGGLLQTGGRYNPSTDSWTPTSIVNAPVARSGNTAIWTGTEMIVWGGLTFDGTKYSYVNTGGRYNPATDSWTATSTTSVPAGRVDHTVVWTGTEMIVWGGFLGTELNTGGRYNPSTDSWKGTTVAGAPTARYEQTAVWTGREMIVWGGYHYDSFPYFNTGGRYDPVTDSWQDTTTKNAPSPRDGQAAVWDGFEMVVWGGGNNDVIDSSGGRYDPVADSWTATSTATAPVSRFNESWVWTGSEMIIWGGDVARGNTYDYFNTGGRYNPFTDSWLPTTTSGAPSARLGAAAVWTGSQMIVWGGGARTTTNTGGRYCAAVGPTPTPTPVPLTLHADGKKVRGTNTVTLTWSGANSTNVDLYRDGIVLTTTANDGAYVDAIGNGNHADYTYKVCEAGSQTCSNEVVVSFGQSIDATWSANPVSGDWNDPHNWNPQIVPSGPFAKATFNTSTITDVSISGTVSVQDIIFPAGASPFTITVPANASLVLGGAGMNNRSGQTQNVVLSSGKVIFQNSSTAGRNLIYTCNGGVQFADSSDAGTSMFVFSGGTTSGGYGAGIDFRDHASAAKATLIFEAGTVAGARGAAVGFFTGTSAGSATVIGKGGAVAGAFGADLTFYGVRSSEPTIIVEGGTNGGIGAVLSFYEEVDNNLAHVQLNDGALMDISISGGVTIGSLSGEGTVDLGDFRLTVGGNNEDTTFSGKLTQINSEGGSAFLKKVGTGTLTLTHSSNFDNGGITVAGGTVALENMRGSASGSGGVSVEEGTLAGGGITSGAVEIGTGSGPGAFLAPGDGASTVKTLTVKQSVTFTVDGTYTWKLDTTSATADRVIANGVTIETSANFDFDAIGNSPLAAGKVFTAISNTAGTSISGNFANLVNGSTVTVGMNKFQVSYTGGDGNDLTLTVVP